MFGEQASDMVWLPGPGRDLLLVTIWGTLTERRAGRRGVPRPLAAAALVAAMGGAGMPAVAQDAGSLLREQQRRLDMQRTLPGMDADAAAQTPQGRPVTASDEGQTILVTGLRFTGRADLLPPASQASIIAAGKGKRLGIGGIQALASQTTAALQVQGHLRPRHPAAAGHHRRGDHHRDPARPAGGGKLRAGRGHAGVRSAAARHSGAGNGGG
ncbi:hypothetical protein V6L77_00175 [Pannonibacter sp. Pt2-lr]